MSLISTFPEFSIVPQPAISPRDAEIINMWLHGRTSRHTLRAYRHEAETFLAWAGVELEQVTLKQLQNYSDQLKGADSTKVRALACIKSLFSFTQGLGRIQYNTAKMLKLPKIRDDLGERILSAEQVELLIQHAGIERNRLIIRMLYHTGVRVSELCGLAWKDLLERPDKDGQPTGGQITVYGKGGKTRSVLVMRRIWERLQQLKIDVVTPADKVFGLSASQVERIVAAAAKSAGIARATPHYLRHCHASHSLDKGAKIHVIAATLGHGSIAVTSRYFHARPDESSSSYLGA